MPVLKKPKLLIIYYNFPPVKVPGALRVHYICRLAPHYFSEVFAITTRNRCYFSTDPDLRVDEVDITEVPALDIRYLTTQRNVPNNQPFISGRTKRTFWGKRLRRWIDSFPFNILIGDGGLVYIIQGFLAGKRLVEKNGITHIFSTFRPYSDHVIAYLLKKRFQHIVWVADYRDLHLDEKNGRQLLFWPLQVWFNKKMLTTADKITTVSSGLKEKLAALGGNVSLLRNGIPQSNSNSSALDEKKFVLSYTGRIYPGEQNGALIFEAVRQLIRDGAIDGREIKLTYAGPTPEYWQEWVREKKLQDQGHIRGMLSLAASRELQRASAINISLAFSSKDQKGDISSKIYEYLASGNAIVSIINGEKDEEQEIFFNRLAAGLLLYNEEKNIGVLKEFILARYCSWKNGVPEIWPKNRDLARTMSTEHQFRSFFDALIQQNRDIVSK
ncbi:glycosyltransferase family protein [Flavilitoribacter nigricans]|uniref:Glycosyltransferase subfamily 4-like N-terminal domain-containing protein n=1 Tax=Flavilitoribacter nigricans (strain ATCC 23147 / DSM 23189 / NBRC 102662 / NCIMB 1420 / SS-2) TaxID=1122177 RepID=A0A2D0MYX4_FLAN2|nr:hypothetical protein [Flavilitoribacter nigricans]PHN01474.1 hypothetical protein CRP01_36850 [Flavilitoribacter nigricans DSM 23189 = NBRC 102662]